ncbi:hypothetical protein ACFQ51_40270 [Streptomyces kaempferi]
MEGLTREKPGAFDFRLYPDQQAARSAIKNRDAYGAFAISDHRVTVLKATAASPSVAQLLTDVGQQLADRATQQMTARQKAAEQKTDGTHSPAKAHKQTAAQQGATRPKGALQGAAGADSSVKVLVKAIDVVPVATDDPRGVVFSSSVFPLTICGILIGAFVTMARGLARPRHRVLTLLVACAVAALGVYLVAQGFLGALPHNHVATWAILALDLLSISATTAGVIRLLGPAGLGLSAALMVFVGNAFSGATSAPEMLPKGVDYVGQWLPPGAGASLLRNTTYFDGNADAATWPSSPCGASAGLRQSCTATGSSGSPRQEDRCAASMELLPALPGSGTALSVRRHAHARRHDGDD